MKKDQARNDWIRSLFNIGVTVRELCEEFDLTRQRIHVILKQGLTLPWQDALKQYKETFDGDKC